MNSKIKNFLKTSAVYFLGNVFTKLLTFLLLPLFTNQLEPADYGQYGLVISVVTIVIPIIYMCVWDGMFRMAFLKEELSYRHYVINNGFAVMLVSTIVYVTGAWIFMMCFDVEHAAYIILYGVANAFQYFYSFSARSLYSSRFFVLSGCFSSLVYLTMSYYFILYQGSTSEILYVAYAAGILVQILILEGRDRVIAKFKWKDVAGSFIKKLLKLSIPLAVTSTMNWFFLGLAQVVISWRLGVYDNAQYNVASKFSSILSLLVNVVQFAWYELAYELANAKDTAKQRYQLVIGCVIKALFMAYPFLIIGIKIIYPYYIGQSYQESLNYIPFILLSTLFSTTVGFISTIFIALKDSKSIMISNVIAGISSAVLMFSFVDRFKMVGVLGTLCFVNAFNLVMKLVQLKKIHEIKVKVSVSWLISDIVFVGLFYLLNVKVLILATTIYLAAIVFFQHELIKQLIRRARYR